MDVFYLLDDYQIYYFNNFKIFEFFKSKIEKSDEFNLFVGVKDFNFM